MPHQRTELIVNIKGDHDSREPEVQIWFGKDQRYRVFVDCINVGCNAWQTLTEASTFAIKYVRDEWMHARRNEDKLYKLKELLK